MFPVSLIESLSALIGVMKKTLYTHISNKGSMPKLDSIRNYLSFASIISQFAVTTIVDPNTKYCNMSFNFDFLLIFLLTI